LNEQYLLSNKNSLSHIVAAAESMFFLDSTTQAKAVQMATDLSSTLENRTWKICRRVLKYLSNGQFGSVADNVINEYKTKCHALFPNAMVFSPTPTHVSVNHEPMFGNDNVNTTVDEVEE